MSIDTTDGFPDHRSRFHRACIHVGWWGLVAFGIFGVWSLRMGGSPHWLRTIDAVTSSLTILVGLGLCWAVHIQPPGHKLDFFLPGHRRPAKHF